MAKKIYYNIRLIVNKKDKTFTIGFVHRLRQNKSGGGTWIEGSKTKIAKLLCAYPHKFRGFED